MEDLEHRLAAIGYRRAACEPERWRVSQIRGPAVRTARQASRSGPLDPARSVALQLWLARLAKGEQPRPYRIYRVPEG
jgi:hypothetical protein